MTSTVIGATARVRPALATDATTLVGHEVLLLARRPAAIIAAIVLPLIFALLFAAVFARVMAAAAIDYPQYLLPAIIVQSAFFTGIGASIGVAEQAASGFARRLRGMPVHRGAPVLAVLGAAAVRTAVTLVVVVPVGLLLGFRFRGTWPATAGFLVLAILAAVVFTAGFVALGLAIGRVSAVQAVANLVLFPLLLLSNTFSPTAAFPSWLRPVVEAQPVSRIGAALRSLADGTAAVGPVSVAMIWLVGLGALFVGLAARATGRTR